MRIRTMQTRLSSVVLAVECFNLSGSLTKPEPDSFWMSAEHNMRPVFDCLSLGCEGIRRITKTRCPIFVTARDRNQAILLDPFILRPSFGKLIEVDLQLVDPSRYAASSSVNAGL